MLRFRFPIVIIDEDFRSENTSGLGIRALAQAIEKEGFEVLGATSYGDLTPVRAAAKPRQRLHPVDRRRGVHARPRARPGGAEPAQVHPARSASRTPTSRSTCTARRAPRSTSRTTSCASCTASSTCSRTRRSSWPATSSARPRATSTALAPPFFKALMDYAQDGSYSWHCPGHSRRRGVPEEPGRPDVPPVLRREHAARRRLQRGRRTRPAARPHRPGGGRARRNAARIFNADHCFFVTNGTSTSNKMVWHHTVAPGDVVVVDRNCHKSILHSIIMTGAVPVFLTPTRNHFGIIGPIPQSEFAPEAIQAQDRRQPAAGRRRREPGQAAHPDADAEHLRRRALQHRDHQGHARRLHRHPAFRRSLAAARRLPPLLRQLPRDGQDAPAAEGRAGLRHAVARTSCWPAISQASQVLVQDSQNAQARPPPVQRGLPDAHLDQPAVRDHRLVRRGRGDDGGARRHGAGGGEHSRGARLPPRDAQGRQGVRHATGGSRSGARTSWPARASAAATTGCSKAEREVARLRRPGATASTCSTRSRARSSRRGWT